MNKILSILAFSVLSSTVTAQEFFWTVQPSEIIADGKYIGLRIAGNQRTACYYAHADTSLFVKPYTDANANAVLSVLLTAQTTKKQVYIRVTDDELNQAIINNIGVTNCYLDYVSIAM